MQLPNKNQIVKKGGFTLIELLVVVGIFVLLSAALIISYASTAGKSNLNTAQSRVFLMLKEARSMAVNGIEFDTGVFPNYAVLVKKGSNAITVFVDCRSEPTVAIFNPSAVACNGKSSIVKTVSLGGNVVIGDVLYNTSANAGGPGTSVDTAFIEYLGSNQGAWIVYRTGGAGAGVDLKRGSVSIELASRQAEATTTVTAWTTGLVTYEGGKNE